MYSWNNLTAYIWCTLLRNSCHIDDISAKRTKDATSNIINLFIHIINGTLNKVILVSNDSVADKLNNYRSVSVSPVFSKIQKKTKTNLD